MSKDLKKLLKQQEALAEQIKQAEQLEKNRTRIERATVKAVSKHPELYTAEPSEFQQTIEAAIKQVLKEKGFIVE